MMRRPPSPRQFRFLMPLGFIAVHFAMAAVLMWLWNYALVAVSPLRAVNYWQALSILVICRILFGSRPRPRHHHRMKEERMHRLRERMSQMTDEERRHFKERLRRRFGRHPHPHWPPFEEEDGKTKEV